MKSPVKWFMNAGTGWGGPVLQDDGICQRCLNQEETIQHLFKDCPDPAKHWAKWKRIRSATGESEQQTVSLLKEIIEAVDTQNANPASFYVIVTLTSRIWLDRKERVFQNKITYSPLGLILIEALRSVEADMQLKGNIKG
ncbi:hypothetical protein R1flu_023731 [Riccia fluitans]|uniref:Reverse transcriptase zinc-binding domain-containing protein n=1 Tax=Riccia fluitans TaxID=41844 RepID=A0ABD1XSY6_9MARC